MAKERLSNEIIAQVLTQSIANLEKTLKAHQGKIEQLAKEPIPINTKELREVYTDITKNTKNIEQNLNQYKAELQKVDSPLKLARKVLLYAILFMVLVLVSVTVTIWLMNQPTTEEKLKAKFLDEVFFEGEHKGSRIKYYEEWKKK